MFLIILTLLNVIMVIMSKCPYNVLTALLSLMSVFCFRLGQNASMFSLIYTIDLALRIREDMIFVYINLTKRIPILTCRCLSTYRTQGRCNLKLLYKKKKKIFLTRLLFYYSIYSSYICIPDKNYEI